MEVTRAERLQAFLDETAEAPVVWGESDCCAWPAKWIERERGVSINLPRYASRKEAHALIAKSGGLLPLVSEILSPLGLWQTHTPQLGDVGIIQVSTGEVGVIFCHVGIAAWRNDAGGSMFLYPVPRTIVAAWSV